MPITSSRQSSAISYVCSFCSPSGQYCLPSLFSSTRTRCKNRSTLVSSFPRSCADHKQDSPLREQSARSTPTCHTVLGTAPWLEPSRCAGLVPPIFRTAQAGVVVRQTNLVEDMTLAGLYLLPGHSSTFSVTFPWSKRTLVAPHTHVSSNHSSSACQMVPNMCPPLLLAKQQTLSLE